MSDGEGDGLGAPPQPFSLSQQDMVSNLTSAVGGPLPPGAAAPPAAPGVSAAGTQPRGAAPPGAPSALAGIPGVPAGKKYVC